MLIYVPVARYHRTQSLEEPGLKVTQGGQEKMCRAWGKQTTGALKSEQGLEGHVRVPSRTVLKVPKGRSSTD